MQNPSHPRRRDLDTAATLEMTDDASRTEAMPLAQAHDPLDHIAFGGSGAVIAPRAAVPQPARAGLLAAIPPLAQRRRADAVVGARRRDVARYLLGVAKHRQAMPDLALLLSIVHQAFPSRKTLTVIDLRQFQNGARPRKLAIELKTLKHAKPGVGGELTGNEAQRHHRRRQKPGMDNGCDSEAAVELVKTLLSAGSAVPDHAEHADPDRRQQSEQQERLHPRRA